MKEIKIENHELVPKHEILSEEEKQRLLSKYGITLRNLPRIHLNDPMVKRLNAKVGDIIKITRKSDVAGEVEYYRVVIKE